MGLFSNFFNKSKSDSKEDKHFDIPASKEDSHKPLSQQIRISCDNCDGYYKIRSGKYGYFAGCSNFPNCKSTLKLSDIVLRYIEKYGLKIYCWKKKCYKCSKFTPVYSYYLNYDLEEMDEVFSMCGTIGLGDLSYIDEMLSKELPSIQNRYSKIINSTYMANTCEYCGALQGRNYVVEDPHEIIMELWHNRDMEKFLFKRMEIKDLKALKSDVERLYAPDSF